MGICSNPWFCSDSSQKNVCVKIKSKIVKTTFSQIYPLSTDFANFSEYSVQSLFILRQIGQAGPITPPHAIPLWINQQKKLLKCCWFLFGFCFLHFSFLVFFFKILLFLFICSPRSWSSCKDDHQWVPSGSAPWSCRCLQPKISCADFYKQIKKYLVSRVWSCKCLQPGI